MAIKFLSGLNLSNVTAGSLLKLDSNGNIVAAVDGTDYNTASADSWSDVGSNIYRNSDVRIGTYQSGVAPAARLHVFDYQTTDPKLLIEDGNTGDASMQFKISTQQYTMGIDNSDGDKFIIANSSGFNLAANTHALEISTNGKITVPAHTSHGSIRLELGGYNRLRFNGGIDLLGYGSDHLWVIGNSTTNTINIGADWDWDKQVAISYTPNTVGGAGGVMILGQTEKNNANWTHGTTKLYTNGTERLRIDSNGNVGIGVSSPPTDLALGNGTHTSPDDTNRILNWYSSTGGDEINNASHYITVGQSSSDTTQPKSVGLALFNQNTTNNTYSPAITFGGLSTSGNYMNGAAAIAAQLVANANDSNFRSGELTFYTQGTTTATRGLTERMRIDGSGNVGIGTSDPSYKLHVEGNVGITEYLQHKGDNNTYLRFSTDLIRLAAGGVEMIRLLENATQDTLVINEGGADVDFRVESDTDTHAFFVQGSDGMVGVKNSSPHAELVVGGRIDTSDTDNGAFRIYNGSTFRGGWGTANWAGTNFGDSSSDLVAYVNGSNKYFIGTNAQPRLTVDGSGNVGMGTTSPEEKLHVIGNIKQNDFIIGRGAEHRNGNLPTYYKIAQVTIDGTYGTSHRVEGTVSYGGDNQKSTKIDFWISFRSVGNLNVGSPLVRYGYKVENLNVASSNGFISGSVDTAFKVSKTSDTSGGNKVYEIQFSPNDIDYVNAQWELKYSDYGNQGSYPTTVYSTLQTVGTEISDSNILKSQDSTRVDNNTWITQLGVGSSNNTNFDLYNNGNSYFNGNVTIDANLSMTGGGYITTDSNNPLVLRSDIQIGQGDEDPVIEFKYGTTSLGKIDQFGDIHAGGFKVSGTTGFLKSDGSVDTSTYVASSALSSYLPLTGGTMTGDLVIDSGGSGSTTQAYSTFDTLTFNNLHNTIAAGPNKIIMYDDGAWKGGFGIHNSTVAYYSGATHVWYKTGSGPGGYTFTERMTLDGSGNLSVDGTLTGTGGSFSDTITSTKNGTAFIMDGGSSAEGVRMKADSDTTYPVFLRSLNPSGGGETSAWLFKENNTAWGIWHNNPINTIDFTRSPSTGIANDVGGGDNTVMIRLDMQYGHGRFAGNVYSSGGNSTEWNTAYDWGNHASAGYLTAHPSITEAADVNNSNGTVIQDLTFDDNGHVTATGSVDLDGRYYTESEINTFFNRGYITHQQAGNLAIGWYTIAQNTGDRALGEFQIWDTNSSRHQSVIFNAAHHFGVDDSNSITVLANSSFGTDVFRYIRIKENSTYDGAAIQVYIDNGNNDVHVAIIGANAQESGWTLVDWLADATAPSAVSGWSTATEKSKVDLDNIHSGGIATTGKIYAGGATTQYRVLTTNDEGSGNSLDADTVDGIHASSFLRSDTSDTTSGNITIAKNNPVLVLNETTSDNDANQIAYISFQDNGTEEAWVGWGSGSNTDFTVRNSIGNVVLSATNTSVTGSLYVPSQIIHTGDTDTYIQFHADNQWRVVTGGTERLEVNDTATTVANTLTASGGINGLTLTNGISGTNFNITGVNELRIADPGEGIVFTNGSSGNMTLAIVDDSSDNILRFSGTNATFDVAGALTSTNLTIADAVYHEGDTNTSISFGTDTINFNTGGGVRATISDSGAKFNNNTIVAGGSTLSLGERAEGDDNGRTVLIEGTANGSSGEGSGRIFFTEHNSTDASADKYGLSLYYEGDPNAQLPSGFQPNTGNATWSLRRHDNSVNGAAIISGSRGNSNVTFGGNLYVPNVIYHAGDTNTYMQFHAADQWRVVTGGSERLEVNNTYTTVANDFWAEDKSHAGNQNWKTKTYVRAVGVEGGSIADKWVQLTTVDIDASYDKAALKFKIHGFDDVSCGTENIDVLYENGGSVQETHRLDWYSTDGTANLFKAVKSTHSGSNLSHSYELWVQMAGDWRDTFTVEVETWTDEAGFITYSEAVGQATAPSGDTNDQSKTSREWYTKNTTIYADGTALQTQSQADSRYLQLTGGTVSGAVTLGAQLTLSSFGTGLLRVDAGSVSVDTSNYLTSMPANSTVTSVTFGGVKVEEASDRPGLLEINRDGTDTWSGIMTKFSGTAEWALMGNETSFGLYDDQQNEWAWRYVENSYFEANHNGSTKFQTASNGAKIIGTLELGTYSNTTQGVILLNGSTANKQAKIQCTNGNLHIDSEDGNALYLNYYEGTSDNIIFGNGNGGASGAKVTSSGVVHATSVEVAGNLSVRNISARDIVSAADRTYALGTDANRWAVVFCETLDSAGQHESNLQDEEQPISQYETGTVLSWKDGKNRPCTQYADHMRMGIAVHGQDSPLIQGAEPVLCTGVVEEGDYLVTSDKEGHAVAVPRNIVKEQMLFDCVIGKALENGEGESHLVKTWINI